MPGRPAWPTGIGATTSRAFVGGPGRGGARGRAATGHVSQGVHRWLAATNRTSPSGCHCDATAMTEGSRRFPPPWRADGTPHGYVVRDANGQELVYIYSRENEDEARQAKVLTKDEARRVAINIARLPELLGGTA